MKFLTRSVASVSCAAAMGILVLGCQTIAYKPETAQPASEIVVTNKVVSHYVRDDLLDVSVGMTAFSYDAIAIPLFLHNKSEQVMRFDPLSIRCTGFTRDGGSQEVPIFDPDKYVAGLRALSGFAILAGDPYSYSRSLAEADELSRRLLRKRDVLPAQQCEGLLLARRIYEQEAQETQTTTAAPERVFDRYEVVLTLLEKEFVFRFSRLVVKKQSQ